MSPRPDRVFLLGSEPPIGALEGPRQAVEASEVIEVTLYCVARADGLGGSDPDHFAALESFAHSAGFSVVRADSDSRRLIVRAPAGVLGEAFGITLERTSVDEGSCLVHRGAISVPTAVAPALLAVLGLDGRPHARPRFRPALGTAVSYTPIEVAAAYSFPTATTGAGQAAAVIELGGGYRDVDLAEYFSGLALGVPTVVALGVDGGSNAPTGSPSGPDAEVMLDLEVLGSLAPDATIVAVFAPNTDRGFVDAISAAIHDTTQRPSVISISWGGPEEGYSTMARTAFEAVLTEAVRATITVCVATGDQGSSDGVNDGLAHVDYPAASPQVLACGGTRLEIVSGSISSEVVWNDLPSGGATGGGISPDFAPPVWQEAAHVPPSANPGGVVGRGVPDVSGNADPQTGYQVRVDGIDAVYGGTSAVAPLWSALILRINEALKSRVGFVNPDLYRLCTGDFYDIVQGDNGAYQAGVGWDPCSGWGSPNGSAILATLRASSLA
ncbi:MAG: S53 family peptidase [Ferrimicrobium sp.]